MAISSLPSVHLVGSWVSWTEKPFCSEALLRFLCSRQWHGFCWCLHYDQVLLAVIEQPCPYTRSADIWEGFWFGHCDSLFQALCQCGRLKKKAGDERGLVEKEGATGESVNTFSAGILATHSSLVFLC